MVRATLIAVSLVIFAGCADEDAPPPRVSGADVYLKPDTTSIRGLVPDRSTMDSMLRAHGLGAAAVDEVVTAARAVFDPRRLRSLQPFLLERTVDGALRLFEYEIDADSFLRITKTPDASNGLRAEVLPIPKTLESVTASGEIGEATPSLFQSIEAAGEGIDLAIAMAEVFAGEIDFNTDLQPGDRYTLTFERFRRDGRPNIVWRHHGGAIRERRSRASRVPLHHAGEQTRLLRRERPFAQEVLPAIAPQVRAAGDVGLLGATHASCAAHGESASRC